MNWILRNDFKMQIKKYSSLEAREILRQVSNEVRNRVLA